MQTHPFLRRKERGKGRRRAKERARKATKERRKEREKKKEMRKGKEKKRGRAITVRVRVRRRAAALIGLRSPRTPTGMPALSATIAMRWGNFSNKCPKPKVAKANSALLEPQLAGAALAEPQLFAVALDVPPGCAVYSMCEDDSDTCACSLLFRENLITA